MCHYRKRTGITCFFLTPWHFRFIYISLDVPKLQHLVHSQNVRSAGPKTFLSLIIGRLCASLILIANICFNVFHCLVCNQRADIGFAIDASTSVRGSGFRKSKDFIKFVLQRFKISELGIHVGLIRFSTTARVIFNFEEYYTNGDINAAVDSMRYVKGGTYTDRALRLARTKLFLEKPLGSSRPLIPKFLVVMTDGISKNTRITAMEAKVLKERGVHIIVVGVGRNLARKELINIASSPQDVITATSFRALKKIVVVAKEKVCGGKFQSSKKGKARYET